MTSTIIIPNEAMLSVLPIPPSYIGKEVEVTFSLVNGKTAIREQQILEPDDDFTGLFQWKNLRKEQEEL